jgi:hypothetical protein
MAAADDFKILDEAVKDGKQSVTLPDGRTFTLEAARDERDRLGKEIAAAKAAKDREQSSAKLEIQNAETLVQKAANVVTANLRAFDKGNASAETVRRSQQELQSRQEGLARLKSATVVTAPATAATAAVTPASATRVLSREQRGESVTPVPEEEDAPVVKPTKVVITKTQVDKKLVELNLADTPENRKVARQALKTGTTAAPGAEDTAWEPLFKQNYPQYSWMFTDLDRTKYADVFDLFKRAQQNKMLPEEFDRQYIGTSFYRELQSSKKGRELSAAIGNFTWGSGNLAKFLTKATQFGYEGENLKQQAYKELFSKVDGKYANDLAVGEIKKSTPYLSLKDIGKQYFWDIGDSQIEQVLSGVEDAVTGIATSREDLIRKARLYAKGKYAHLSEQIDGGLTMEDLAASYREKAAKLLELDPLTMNFDRDYSDALGSVDRPRVLSMSEWETELRTKDKYKYSFTKQANQDATDIGLAIARAFGKVA